MISRSVRMAALIATMLAVPGLQAAEVAGVRIDDQITVGDKQLVLNGAGLRTKVIVKVYVGALYVTQKSSSPAALIDATTPRRMNMRLMRDVDSDSLFGALRDGLKANNSEAELAALKEPSDQFAAIMKKIGNAKEGDTVSIDFTAEGVAVGKNGEARGQVGSLPFARALLKVWLGNDPVDGALKKALLGS